MPRFVIPVLVGLAAWGLWLSGHQPADMEAMKNACVFGAAVGISLYYLGTKPTN